VSSFKEKNKKKKQEKNNEKELKGIQEEMTSDSTEQRMRGSVMKRTSEIILLGDSEGVAFSLDRNLAKGRSTATLSFGNPPLSPTDDQDGHYEVLEVEVWTFQRAL